MGVLRRLAALLVSLASLTSCVHTPAEQETCSSYCTDFASCATVLRAASAYTLADQDCYQEAITQVAGSGADGDALIRELAGSESRLKRVLGARAAAIVPLEEYDQVVPSLAEAYRAYPDPAMALYLRGIHDPRVVAAFLDDLSNPKSLSLRGTILGLTGMGHLAESALPRLREIAESHWDGDVRGEAAHAYGVMAGTSIEPGPDRCPVAVRREPAPTGTPATWTVTLNDSVVGLRDLDTAPQREGACSRRDHDPSSGRVYSARVGDECVVARAGFACSGRLEVWRGEQLTRLGGTSAGPVVPRQNDVVLLGSCCHLGCSWDAESLIRSPEGSWSRHELADAFGHLVAFAADDAAVDLLVHGASTRNCARRTRVEGVDRDPFSEGTFVLLHIDSNGLVTARQ